MLKLEWARVTGRRATVGSTEFAQEHLGDVVTQPRDGPLDRVAVGELA
jgi:glycine cleavage system H lipoate-binding protein